MIKTKPTYNLWQNSAYIIKNAWKRDKIVLLVILIQIILAVTISTAGIFLPAAVVEQITNSYPAESLITVILLYTFALVLLHAVRAYFESTASIRRIKLRYIISEDIMNKVITTDYANLEEQRFIDARQKALDQTNHNGTSTEQVYYCFTNLGTNLLGFAVYITLLAAVNPLVLLITGATAVFGAVTRHWANKWQHDHDDEQTTPNKRMWHINTLGENLRFAKDIRLFKMVDWIRDVFSVCLKMGFDFNKRVQIRHLAADGVTVLATFVREGIAYAYLIWMVLNGGLTAEGFVLLFAAVGGFSGWITGILSEFSALSVHSLNYCRVREFLEYPDTFKRSEGESITPLKGAGYSLELKNVSFRYSGADTNVLENISLTIKPGEKLAVVGLNGAGKTTMVKLLCGFYDPTAGECLLNGKNIRDFNRLHYYGLFTALFQEFNILPLSIAENIAQDFTGNLDEARVKSCLELAGLVEKIQALPGGAASMLLKEVMPNATELSGGETQRLMLARALYKDSPILILDEPTAALDPIAESKLYERYNELSSGRTSVYISHRLASTRFCDRIILMDNKTIIESGTHEELIKKGGKYAELFEIQSKYYREGVEF
jgi:ATP-binding cassette subfamily B protein